MTSNLWLIWIMMFCNIINLIIFALFYYVVIVNHFFFTYQILLIPYAKVSIKSLCCILLSSFELKGILLISSVKTLSFTFKTLLCFQFYFIVFYEFFVIFFKAIYNNFIFFKIIHFIIKFSCFLTAFIIFKYKFSFYNTFFVPFAF